MSISSSARNNNATTFVTTKDYPVTFGGYSFIIPAGSRATNKTACGVDDNYRFWVDFSKVAEQVTGFKQSLLHHDLTYYGVNIPKEYFDAAP